MASKSSKNSPQRRKTRKTKARPSIVLSSLTVLIHGTAFPIGPLPPWVDDKPGTLHRALKDRGHKVMPFYWPSGALLPKVRHQQRVEAAKELVRTLANMQIGVLRVIAHSHGNTAASIATWDDLIPGVAGIRPSTLVMLSPAVNDQQKYMGVKYWPDINHVGDTAGHKFYNFHLVHDPVLASDWNVDFDGTPLDSHETEAAFDSFDHWYTTYPSVWEDNGWFDIVKNP